MVNSAASFSSISTPTSYPEPKKRYLQGSRPDLRVSYREVVLSPTYHNSYIEDNPPIPIYNFRLRATRGNQGGIRSWRMRNRGEQRFD